MPEGKMATSAGARARRRRLPKATSTRRKERPARATAFRRNRGAAGGEDNAATSTEEMATSIGVPAMYRSRPETGRYWTQTRRPPRRASGEEEVMPGKEAMPRCRRSRRRRRPTLRRGTAAGWREYSGTNATGCRRGRVSGDFPTNRRQRRRRGGGCDAGEGRDNSLDARCYSCCGRTSTSTLGGLSWTRMQTTDCERCTSPGLVTSTIVPLWNPCGHTLKWVSGTTRRVYTQFVADFDQLMPDRVRWTSYTQHDVNDHAPHCLADLCTRDQELWRTTCHLVLDVHIEPHNVHRVLKQLGMYQEFPPRVGRALADSLHRYSRKGLGLSYELVIVTTVHPTVQEWEHAADNLAL
uniref:Aminotransferase-like plant mobile domain-containing protein n=1 Tax=Oryza sativa subsp. japonica TaxID=39947 RepID=Q8S621_ORYSJ|nr:hypothetical protein [Oryza sativa Japonica Group]